MVRFESIEMSTYYNTLILTGPKGCGKTSALLLLVLKLAKEKKKAYYIDLGMTKVVKQILQQLEKTVPTLPDSERPILLIDNLQLINNVARKDELLRFDAFLYPTIVAACSPRYSNDDIALFKKERGDGKVRSMFFRPLSYSDAIDLLKHKFPEMKVLDVDADPPEQSESRLPITTFTKEKFAHLVYVTGGVPRYLVDYCETGEHAIMESELSTQFDSVKSSLSQEQICRSVIEIETGKRGPGNLLIRHGIAYVDKHNQVCIVSPRYLQFALEYNNLLIETRHDWQKLEMLTVFNLKFVTCIVENWKQKKMELPIPTQFVVQKKIGDIPLELEEGSVTLMELASEHPCIDLILIDKHAKNMDVYFIQVSFSLYERHKSKHSGLDLNEIASKSIRQHYSDTLKYEKEYFVYATPEFECKCHDEMVYFLDLRRQVFHKVRQL